MQSQKEKNNVTLAALGGLGGFLVLLGILFLRVQYLEAKNAFLALGQHPQGMVPLVTTKDYSIGNPHALVTLIEYSDFECPDCQEFHKTLTQLLSHYGERIRLVSRRFPLPQNQHAEKEAEAALCAGKLGGNTAFWKFSDTLFATVVPTAGGIGLPLEKLPILAKAVGISEHAFIMCLDSAGMKKEVSQEETSGSDSGVHVLPGIFVIDQKGNSILLTGNQPFAVMQTVIDHALQL